MQRISVLIVLGLLVYLSGCRRQIQPLVYAPIKTNPPTTASSEDDSRIQTLVGQAVTEAISKYYHQKNVRTRYQEQGWRAKSQYEVTITFDYPPGNRNQIQVTVTKYRIGGLHMRWSPLQINGVVYAAPPYPGKQDAS